MRIAKTPRIFFSLLVAAVFATAAFAQSDDQSTKQDMKDAGHSTAQATKNTAHKVKKATKTGAHKTAHATKKAAQKAEDKTE
jgi:hypothetical protein